MKQWFLNRNHCFKLTCFMKTYSFILITIIFSITAKCQLFDSCYLRCKYAYSFQKDSTNDKLWAYDLMTLEIGTHSSLFFSDYRRIGDSLLEADQKSGKGPTLDQPSDDRYYFSKSTLVLAKNFPEDKLTVAEVLMQGYRYEEPLIKQKWSIQKDTATINNLICQKATTSFRGRNYIAWFTKKIAAPEGPWKFNGLPGLIVKVTDTKMQFVFELKQLEQLPVKQPMFFPQSFNGQKYIPTDRKQFAKLKQRMKENPIGFFEENSRFQAHSDLTVEERKNRREPYNPIELE